MSVFRSLQPALWRWAVDIQCCVSDATICSHHYAAWHFKESKKEVISAGFRWNKWSFYCFPTARGWFKLTANENFSWHSPKKCFIFIAEMRKTERKKSKPIGCVWRHLVLAIIYTTGSEEGVMCWRVKSKCCIRMRQSTGLPQQTAVCFTVNFITAAVAMKADLTFKKHWGYSNVKHQLVSDDVTKQASFLLKAMVDHLTVGSLLLLVMTL